MFLFRANKSYYIYCEECSENYCSIGSSTWYETGTVARRYGYCPSCCGGTTSTWSWSGNIVKLRCKKCDDMYGLICWHDWKHRSSDVIGYCGDCYNVYQARIKEEEERRRRIKCQYCRISICDTDINDAKLSDEQINYIKETERNGVVLPLCYKCIGRGICNCCKCDKYCNAKQFSYDDTQILSSIGSMKEILVYIMYTHEGFKCCDECYQGLRRKIDAEKRKRAGKKEKEEWDRSWFGKVSNFGKASAQYVSDKMGEAADLSAQYISDKAEEYGTKAKEYGAKAKDKLVDKETWVAFGNATYDGTKYVATITKDKLQDPDFQASIKGKATFCGNNIINLTKYTTTTLVDGVNWGLDSYNSIQKAKKQQKSALIIQSFFRGARDRSKYLKRIQIEKRIKRQEAALIIQSFFRSTYARNEYLNRIKDEKQKKQKWKGTFDHLLIKDLLDKSVIFPWNPSWNRPQWDPEYMKLCRMMKSGDEEMKEQPLNKLLQMTKVAELEEHILSIKYPFRIKHFKAHPSKGIFYLSRGFISNQIDGKGFREMLLWKAKKAVTDGIIDYGQKKLCPTPVDLTVSTISKTFGTYLAPLIAPLVLKQLHLPFHLSLHVGALHVSVPLVYWAGFALCWIFEKILGKIAKGINNKLYPKLMKAKEELKTSVAEGFGYPKDGEQELKAGAVVLFCENEDMYEENGDVMKEDDMVEKLEGMTERDLRKRYHELCMKYHPDKGGNEQDFKNLQQRYDRYKRVYSFK